MMVRKFKNVVQKQEKIKLQVKQEEEQFKKASTLKRGSLITSDFMDNNNNNTLLMSSDSEGYHSDPTYDSILR